MKKVAGVLFPLVLCIWLNASVALAQKCNPDDTPTVKITLENNTFSYPFKDTLSKPFICRNKAFTVSVDFKDGTIEKMVLKNFRPTVARQKKWEKLSNSSWASKQLVFVCASPPCAGAGAITKSETLPSVWKGKPFGVKTRIILMTVELYLKNGTKVTFDPPWGEKP